MLIENMEQLNHANSLVEQWSDERRWCIAEPYRGDIGILARLAYGMAVDSMEVSGDYLKLLEIFTNGEHSRFVKAFMVVAEVLFCLGFEAGKKVRDN